MPSILHPNELVIDDDYEVRHRDSLMMQARGYDPDSVDRSIYGMMGPPGEIALIPRSEWSARIKEKESTKSNLSDILKGAGIPSTDQNGFGYCWAFSTTGAIQALRAFNNQPYIPLNGCSIAATIKSGRDEGGWCGLSLRFAMEHGIAPMGTGQGQWPALSRAYQKYEPACRDEMAKFKVSEGYIDLTKPDYDQTMTFDQVASCLLSNIPCALDFNWLGHSMMGVDLVEVSSGSFGVRIRNSWTDSWGDKGFSVLQGQKAIPDNAVGFRVTGGVA